MNCKSCGSPSEKDYCSWCQEEYVPSGKKCYICDKEYDVILHNKKGRYICNACEGDYSPVINSKS